LDQITVVIQNTSAHKRLLAPAAATEVDLNESTEDSLEDSCIPVLRSSLKRHRIVDMGSSEAETMPQPRPETTETPEAKLAQWKAEIFRSAAPLLQWLAARG
jgi:hypothetical protein